MILKEIIDGQQTIQTSGCDWSGRDYWTTGAYFVQLHAMQQVKPIIQVYRQQAMRQKERGINQSFTSWKQGYRKKLLNAWQTNWTNKPIHTPTSQLNHGGIEGNNINFIECAGSFNSAIKSASSKLFNCSKK